MGRVRALAEHARLNRDIKQEKKALEAVIVAEKQGAQYKTLIGLALIGVFLAGGAGLWLRKRANKELQVRPIGPAEHRNVAASEPARRGPAASAASARGRRAEAATLCSPAERAATLRRNT